MSGKQLGSRLKKRVRARQKQVRLLSEVANKNIERNIFRRWHNLRSASRLAAGWIGLIVILWSVLFLQIKNLNAIAYPATPVPGGVYSEGIVGEYKNGNPIFANNEVENAVSKLVFSSLLTYDNQNELIGDLAESWAADDKGVIYTVTLKNNLKWHDGEALTVDDVIYTYQTIQNPDAKSPLFASFKGVDLKKIDGRTVQFILPSAYSPFPHSLVVGIIPKHILVKIPPTQLRSDAFNSKGLIGSGPFEMKSLSIIKDNQFNKAIIQLTKFKQYHKGVPKLDGITIKTYKNDDQLLHALKDRDLVTAAGIKIRDQDMPKGDDWYNFELMSQTFLFLKTTAPLLSDLKMRDALIKSTDVSKLVGTIGYPASVIRGPIMKEQVGYNPKYQQQKYNPGAASQQLDELGWIKNGQFRKKNNSTLEFRLVYENNPLFSRLAASLQEQWAAMGIKLNIQVMSQSNTDRKYLESHDYDILLYGINVGADPDVYAYWHSSQSDPVNSMSLNFSEYKSTKADSALEAGRTRTDPALRAIKYEPFLDAWVKDIPAIGLYQPRYLYIFDKQKVYGIDSPIVNVPSDRFNNVHNWMINVKHSR